ncbi:ROK family transcriptional regulator [Kitasatospora fiedleri]|uniref:ROK family transcriptional regulator n=1 Tax=Kitasatospora fiedleri TaxID=2991545 RepID=UPI00249BEF7E|nr:ROK family transcriptional regulator [Kitasatospora fiedleri]
MAGPARSAPTAPTAPTASARVPRGLFDLPSGARPPAGRTKAQTQDSRPHNRALLLAALFHDGAMSRADLVRASGLTAPTVSALIAELRADGLVADTGPDARAQRRRGKPSVLVEIQDDAAHLVALDLSHAEHFRGALLNLRGEVVERAQLPIGDALADRAADLVEELAADLVARAPGRVLGIGAASPGIVDDRGVIRQAAHLGWHDLPMARRLSDRFHLPAHVGNDVNAAALAVTRYQRSRAQNLMVVATEHGVGAGLVVGGALVEGEQFAAGEIGHVTVEEDGEPCVCGRTGCLDPLIDATALRRRLARVPEADRPAVLARAGQALGTVLAPIVCVLNLNEIILTGPAELTGGPFLDAAVETVRSRTLAPIGNALSIRPLPDPDLLLLGAGSLVIAAELGVF